MKNKEYTLESYRQGLQGMKDSGYIFIPFSQYRKDVGLYALLRHDILFSPERALSLAVEEKKMDIRATYFVDLHSPWYNACEIHVKKILRIIMDLGHYLGLYINPAFWDIPLSCFPTERVVKKDRRVFEIYFPYSVSAVGFDNEERFTSFTSESYDNLINADSDEVNMRYKSITLTQSLFNSVRIPDGEMQSNIQLSICPVYWTVDYMPLKKKVVTSIVNRMGKYYKNYRDRI